jgi:hypothetical protein
MGIRHRGIGMIVAIVRFQEADPEPGKLLLAIRVIGNVGTHEDDITVADLLTGYEILDHVIDLVYSGRAARVCWSGR